MTEARLLTVITFSLRIVSSHSTRTGTNGSLVLIFIKQTSSLYVTRL